MAMLFGFAPSAKNNDFTGKTYRNRAIHPRSYALTRAHTHTNRLSEIIRITDATRCWLWHIYCVVYAHKMVYIYVAVTCCKPCCSNKNTRQTWVVALTYPKKSGRHLKQSSLLVWLKNNSHMIEPPKSSSSVISP